MKWIGALLTLGLTTWIGFDWSKKLENRPRQIRQLKNSLQILEAEMLYSQLPLKSVFKIISEKIPSPTRLFYETLAKKMEDKHFSFREIWHQSLDVLMRESSLGVNELEILRQFGQTLGQHDFTHQQKQIQLSITYLDRELEEARERYDQYAHMSKSLGFLLGLFIVILLI